MVSKRVLNKILIFALLLCVIASGVAGLRLSKKYKVASLSRSDLDLKRLEPKPPAAEDCSGVDRLLTQLRKPARTKLPPENRGTLTKDEIAIYRAVLQQWVAGDQASMNVSVETYPLDILSEEAPCGCLKGIDSDGLLLASHSVHTLTRSVLPRKNMGLVEPNGKRTLLALTERGNSLVSGRSIQRAVSEAFRNGLFSLSEIAFDTEHRRAIVSYSFVCGLLCGSGRTLVLEKVGEEWKPANVECGGWVS